MLRDARTKVHRCNQKNSPSPADAQLSANSVETILFTLLIYFLVRFFLFENYKVVGNSMAPTLEDEQFLVVNKLGYRLGEPQRGDIVVFEDPRDPEPQADQASDRAAG